MAALAKAALKNPRSFVEMFYTGPGNPGHLSRTVVCIRTRSLTGACSTTTTTTFISPSSH
jgi:hypothetical protein